MASEWAAAARLVRRTGFGATGTEVDAAVKLGTAAYVRRILAADPTKDPGAVKTPPPTFTSFGRARAGSKGNKADPDEKKQDRKQLKAQDDELTAWWLRRMLAVEQPFGEKMTFVWHSHFATSLKKVKVGALMLAHNERQRGLATGEFGTLAYTMLTDGATQRWLDNLKNTVKGPNENLSREFMEIFTLGHPTGDGGGYTESDVREGARALTGYKIDPRTGAVAVRAALHDAKPKTLFGRTGDFDAKAFCDAVLARPACAPYVITRLFTRLVSNDPPDKATLARLAASYGPRRNLSSLLTTMLTDPSFAAADGEYVIGPVEWLVGAMRSLKTPATTEQQLKQMAATLDSLGQLPFYPPSVGGWPTGPVWLSTAAADIRFRAATRITQQADLSSLTGSTTAKLEALAHLLGVAAWSDESLGVLKGSVADTKQVVAVALNTPEYLVH